MKAYTAKVVLQALDTVSIQTDCVGFTLSFSRLLVSLLSACLIGELPFFYFFESEFLHRWSLPIRLALDQRFGTVVDCL